jgi:transposase
VKPWHYIGLDVHCQFTSLAAMTQSGRVTKRWQGPTTIPLLAEALCAVPRPRKVILEEGALADWLLRNLQAHADEVVVCEPRRNALIAKDSDKDDPIDAEKLADLMRGGYIKVVHHPESQDRAIFKQHVALYHQTVRHRVREANRSIAYLRRWGIFVPEAKLVMPKSRQDVLGRLPEDATVRADFDTMLALYDVASEQEHKMRQRLLAQARQNGLIKRWQEIPGVGWIRGATFFVFLDTPWRFKTKAKLWRYMGIGLESQHSGVGPKMVHVCQKANRYLKAAILGAARSATCTEEATTNPFAEQYWRWVTQGISPRNARRNLARSLAATLWSMWKTGDVYRPELVGRDPSEPRS